MPRKKHYKNLKSKKIICSSSVMRQQRISNKKSKISSKSMKTWSQMLLKMTNKVIFKSWPNQSIISNFKTTIFNNRLKLPKYKLTLKRSHKSMNWLKNCKVNQDKLLLRFVRKKKILFKSFQSLKIKSLNYCRK